MSFIILVVLIIYSSNFFIYLRFISTYSSIFFSRSVTISAP